MIKNNILNYLTEPIWHKLLAPECSKPYFASLNQQVNDAYSNAIVYPKKEDIFNALNMTPFDNIKVVILGQDPYHGPNQAHGLSFSVLCEKLPPSLKNIYKELMADLNITPATRGDLTAWANQGILLLNATLTVEASKANSHKKFGWSYFTDKIIQLINDEKDHVVFILWGNFAQKKASYINEDKHLVIRDVHPSPLSASRGFFESKPFSKTNHYLTSQNLQPINWDLNTDEISLI